MPDATARTVHVTSVSRDDVDVEVHEASRLGKPCIRGLRITVYEVFEYLASGMSEGEILADFPDLTSVSSRP